MNRRDWLKMLAAGAPAAVLYPHIAQAAHSDTYLIVTDNPDRVLATIKPKLPQNALIENRRVEPSLQDLTIIRNGAIVDPRLAADVDPGVHDLVAYLRSRSAPGTRLVTIEPHPVPRSREVRFEQAGQVVEYIDLSKSYREIVIRGTQGPTVFSLDEGRLRVVRSSCRHELCKRSGAIGSGRLVCVPNRLVASVDGSSYLYDAITG